MDAADGEGGSHFEAGNYEAITEKMRTRTNKRSCLEIKQHSENA